MPEPFHELRERLLLAGVAPRQVRRYLNELNDHLSDLQAEEERAGRGPAEAESVALARLGDANTLAKAMSDQRRLQSWCVRAPWAMFGVAPLLFLAAAYCVALFILWSGWKVFLPGADTPFVPVDGVANIYFGIGRLLYYGAPIFIGWGFGVVAARQRFKAGWPALGLLLTALAAAAAQVRAGRYAVPIGMAHIRLSLSLGTSPQQAYRTLSHALVIFSFAALPWLAWRIRKAHSPAASL